MFDGNAKQGGKGRGKEERDDRIYAEGYGKAVSTTSASRINNAVCKMEETDGFIDNGEAEGDKGINRTRDNAV